MNHVQPSSEDIKVCHVAVADLWAGAEVHLATLLISLARIPGLDVSTVLFNDGRLAEELRNAGIRVTIIREAGNTSAKILTELVKHFRDNTYDVIHTHKPKDNVLGAVAGKLCCIPKIVRTVHGSPEPFGGLHFVKNNLYEFFNGVTNRHIVNKLIAVSSNICTVLSNKFGFDKIACIHNGIDLDRVQVKRDKWDKRTELHLDQRDYLIGTVGRLTPVKGHEKLLKAVSILSHENHRIKLLVVGDGPLKEKLEHLAIQLGIEKDVVLVGHQEDIYDFINAMDVFVLPSLHEGIPMVLLEALALERPVVASRAGGIPEVIEHRVSGLLVSPGDVQELAQNLLALFNDKPFAESMGKAGRRRVEEQFTARLMAQRTAEVYQTLVCHGGSR
jgi:L-malate glycosyltransferase